MGKIKEPEVVYAVQKKSGQTNKLPQSFTHYLFDATGKKIGVQLDVQSYEELLEAKEELEDLRAFDKSVAPAHTVLNNGGFVTLKR